MSSATYAEDQHGEPAEATAEPAAEADPLQTLLFPEPGTEPNYNLPPVQPNKVTFLWSLVVFGTFVLFMRVTTWKPLIAGINSREARVINAEKEAKAAKAEVEKLKAQAESRLAEVQENVKALIAEARAEAESQKREIVAQAEQDAQRIKSEALEAINNAQVAAIQNLDQLVDEQVAMATEHVVGRRL